MCYNGNFMYRGPFISTALQIREMFEGFAAIMGATPDQMAALEALMATKGLSLDDVTRSPDDA